MPQGISQFRSRYPKVEIQLTTGDPASAVQFIQSEQVDLALAGKPNNLPTGLEFYKIDDISLSLIAPRVACLATQLLQEDPINWQQMPFILPLDGMARQRIEQWLRSKHIKHPENLCHRSRTRRDRADGSARFWIGYATRCSN